MGATARAFTAVALRGEEPPDPVRVRLEHAARSLPDSDLKTAILATLAHREPSTHEAVAWIALLQARRSDSDHVARVVADRYGPIQR